jgi:MGT family glycosyltransferase
MSKILFINGNLHGHINPTLPVVKELVQRGEEVYYFSAREFQPKLEAAGAIFMDYGDGFYQFIHNFRPHGNHPFYTLMEYMLAFDRTVIPIVLGKTEGIRFDCLLHDVMFGGGDILAGKLRLPAIASCSSFVMEKPPLPPRMLEPGFHPQLDYLYSELQAAQKEWQVEKLELSDIFFKRAEKILVYTSRLFQPSGDSFNFTFLFTGPSIMDRAESADFTVDASGTKKLVYISMGTINNNLTDFYTKCFEAFSGNDYQVILSAGNKTDISSLPQPPKNFVVRNYVPQLEVLKQADVFICHGGLNSVSEAFYYGVPVIAIPLANDQPAVAKRLTELGAGLGLKMEDITPELLHQTVHTVLSDQSYKHRSMEIGESFRQAGGYQKAADEVMDFIRSTQG